MGYPKEWMCCARSHDPKDETLETDETPISQEAAKSKKKVDGRNPAPGVTIGHYETLFL
jgi:hypothetical protein